jgi:hypothetical protein
LHLEFPDDLSYIIELEVCVVNRMVIKFRVGLSKLSLIFYIFSWQYAINVSTVSIYFLLLLFLMLIWPLPIVHLRISHLLLRFFQLLFFRKGEENPPVAKCHICKAEVCR